MKKLTKYKILTIYCKCGLKLLRYKKGLGRRLLKIHRDRITKDYTSLFKENYSPKDTNIFCSKCKKRLATIKVVNGKYVSKVNQGQIEVRT